MIKRKKKIVSIIIILLLITMACIVGMEKIKVSNFNPINGDWQNYNPIRRLLAGQAPYRDFAVYLGLGHLYLLSFIQLLIGNNFTNSMFASNACTFLIYELALYVISYLILKDKRKSLYFTLAGAIINLYRPRLIINNLNDEFIFGLDYAKSPMNSARLIRNSILIISPLLIMFFNKLIDNTSRIKTNKKKIVKKVMFAIIAGLSIPWSNDGGISTYIAISFIYFLLLIKEHGKNIKLIIRDTFLYIIISLCSLLTIILLVTRGHLLSWFKYTLGVSSYQKWYYGTEIYTKNNICLSDIYVNATCVGIVLLSIVYIYKLFKSKKNDETIRYAMLGIITISIILSTYLYQLLSGGIAIEILSLVMFILILSYITKFIIEFINKDNKMVNKYISFAIIFMALAVCISRGWSASINLIKRSSYGSDYVYIKELGGYFSELGDSIIYAKNRIGNDKIFSTYASAVEAVTNQFQPTGSDYIIHSLGDNQREHYMQIFNKGDFKYVTTINCDYSQYCGWEKNSNWFFFKELYKDYKPSFVTEYNIYFEKKDNKNTKLSDAEVVIDKQNSSNTRIIVNTEDKKFDGIASVKLSYQTKFLRGFLKSFDINKYVYVQDITGKEVINSTVINYFIPNSGEYYVPVTIKNGYGEIRLLSVPQDNTELSVSIAEIEDISTTYFDYAVSANKNPEGNMLYLKNKEENKVILEDATSIKFGNYAANILSMKIENDYIVLELDQDAESFAYPNYFEVIK